MVRVLRIYPAFDRVTPRMSMHYMLGKVGTVRDEDLLLYQVATIHFFGNRMLYLNPGIHLHEVKMTLLVD